MQLLAAVDAWPELFVLAAATAITPVEHECVEYVSEKLVVHVEHREVRVPVIVITEIGAS